MCACVSEDMVVWKLPWTSALGALLLVLAVLCQDPESADEEPSPTSQTVKCPLHCKCPSDSTVNCASAELTEFPSGLSDGIQMLSLENNMIREITVEHVSHLYLLETLNLQNNGLSSDGKLEHPLERQHTELTSAPKALPHSLVNADFSSNELTRVYPYTFGYKPKLRSVYLHNNKLTDSGLPEHMFNTSNSLELLTMSSNLLKEVPRNLPSSLHRLHLKNNKLKRLPAGAFKNLSDLRELHLQDNQLNSQDIEQGAFSDLSSLEYLDLSNNNLSVVPSGLPKTLLLLHLERNCIQSIPADSLNLLRNLEYLLIHNNKLRSRTIHPAAFQGLKKLHTLHMYNNLLERVPRGMPRRAKTLMLLHNSISEIGRNDLALLHTLTELNLSYNRLSSGRLHPEAFRKLRRLQTLDLSGNNLDTLPVGLPRSLQVLEVKNNHLRSIPAGALTGMDQLTRLVLSNNQLKLNSAYQGAWLDLFVQTLDLSENLLSHIPPDLPESLQFLHLQNNRISSVSASAFDGTPNLQGLYLRSEHVTTVHFTPLSH
uniref:LRRNT domain-containing protein n=1 Tax=Neogobius melanostomus TaxID=47308 RepID=A0A8C6T5S2_9GOBI